MKRLVCALLFITINAAAMDEYKDLNSNGEIEGKLQADKPTNFNKKELVQRIVSLEQFIKQLMPRVNGLETAIQNMPANCQQKCEQKIIEIIEVLKQELADINKIGDQNIPSPSDNEEEENNIMEIAAGFTAVVSIASYFFLR